MAQDKDNELDVEATAADIVGDLFPPAEKEEKVVVEDPPVDEKVVVDDPVLGDKEIKGEKEEKLELKPGDEGYVAPVEPKSAPKSWSKEIAPEFTKLAPTVQDYILKREEEFTNGISQYKGAAEYAQKVHAVVSPYFAHIQSRGVSVGDHMRSLLNADYILSTGTPAQKVDFLYQVMEGCGITKEMMGEGPPVKDANTQALEKKIADTEGRITEFERSRMDSARTEVAKAVDAFAADPKNVYFNELGDDIVKLINSGYTLEDAYKTAVWANPVTRDKEQSRISKETEAARKKVADEAALKAKKAARQNVKETPSSRSAPTGLLGSMDDTIRSTLRKINERVN